MVVTQEEIERFQEDGAILLKQVLTPQEVQLLQAGIQVYPCTVQVLLLQAGIQVYHCTVQVQLLQAPIQVYPCTVHIQLLQAAI